MHPSKRSPHKTRRRAPWSVRAQGTEAVAVALAPEGSVPLTTAVLVAPAAKAATEQLWITLEPRAIEANAPMLAPV